MTNIHDQGGPSSPPAPPAGPNWLALMLATPPMAVWPGMSGIPVPQWWCSNSCCLP